MRSELKMHRLLLAMLATLLLGFVGIVLYLSTSVESEDFEATVSLVVVIAVGTAFVYMGTAEGITASQFGMKHRRELWGYLILGLVSVASVFTLHCPRQLRCKRSPLLWRLTPFFLE